MKKTILASTLLILLSVTSTVSAENRTILIEKKKSHEIAVQEKSQSENYFAGENFTIDELKINKLGNGKINITAKNLKNRNSGDQLSYNVTSDIHEIENEIIVENLILDSNNSKGKMLLSANLNKHDLNSNSDIFSILSTSKYFKMEINSSSSLAKMIYLLDIGDNEFLNKLNDLKTFTIDETLEINKTGDSLVVENLTLKLKDEFYINFQGIFDMKDLNIIKKGSLEINFNSDSDIAHKILQILNIKNKNQLIRINNENIANVIEKIK
jgi:hypothetical protein